MTSEAAVLQTDRIGTIASERAANLVVVDGNPLQEIQAAQNVTMVSRNAGGGPPRGGAMSESI